jgi:predicted ABC-type sugar transport system permease subunit
MVGVRVALTGFAALVVSAMMPENRTIRVVDSILFMLVFGLLNGCLVLVSALQRYK